LKRILLSFFACCLFSAAPAQVIYECAFGKIGAYTRAYSIIPFNRDYLLAGASSIAGLGSSDVYLLKIDSNANVKWSRGIGGNLYDDARQVLRASDGGFTTIGTTMSFGNGSSSLYLTHTDSNGILLWGNVYGGVNTSSGYSLVQTSDSGYVLCGTVTENFGVGSSDIWLIRTDAAGNLVWGKTYGDVNADAGYKVIAVNGGFAVTGGVSYGAGMYDMFLMRTDTAGNPLWAHTYGGTNNETGLTIQYLPDGGYAVAGNTRSFGLGNYDVYFVRTDSMGNMLWNRTYGTSSSDECVDMKITPDNGFILGGESYAFGPGGDAEAFLLKIDSVGNTQWLRSYGGGYDEFIYSVICTSDGGYLFAGGTDSYGPGTTNLFAVKTDSVGYVNCNSVVQFMITDSGGVQGSGVLTTNGAFKTLGGNYAPGATTGFRLCSNISVNELENNGTISFYPNPFTNSTTIGGLEKDEHVELYDVNGKLLEIAFSQSGEVVLERGGLQSGVYFVLVRDEAGRVTGRTKLVALPR
jgi:hypothetical protein